MPRCSASLQLTNEWRTNPSAAALGVKTFNNTFSYDPAGNRTLAAAADGTVTTGTYDNANRLQQAVAWTPPSLLATTTYGYDAAGHRTLMQTPTGYTYYRQALPEYSTGRGGPAAHRLLRCRSSTTLPTESLRRGRLASGAFPTPPQSRRGQALGR